MKRRYITAAASRELEAKLTPRDLAITQHLSTLRFVTGAQLTRLCFSGSDARTARRTLLRLTKLGVLQRLPRPIGGIRSGSQGFVYHLGLAGQHLAMIYGWQPWRRRRRSLTPGTLFLNHTLQIAELHIRLIESDRSRRFELMKLTAEPLCHRTYSGLGSQHILKPDSFVRLGLGDYEYSFFIEIDRGTRGTQAIDRQLKSYVSCHQSAEAQSTDVFPLTLWLANTATRAETIKDCVARLPQPNQMLFAVTQFDQALGFMANPRAA